MSSGHRLWGVKYNFLNSTFKIDIKKGLDSEDADRRDSINREISAHSVERMKSYIINTFFLAKWQDPTMCNFQA